MNGMTVAVISGVFLPILYLIVSCQSETDVCTTQLHFRKRIVCYYSGLIPPELIDPCSCTHLVLTNWTINEQQQVFNEKFENVTFVKDLKRKNGNLKVLISIHANLSDLEDNHTFHFVDNETDNSFTRNLMNFFNTGSGSDLCGVELDLVMRTAEHKVTHTKLLQVLRDEFDRMASLQRRKSTSKYLLATTVSINPEDILHAYDLISISRYADLVFLPAYNFGASHDNNSLAHHSRLMGISDIENADSMVDLVISLGLDRQKIVLGIPAFGVAYTLMYSNETSVNSAATKYSDIFPYNELCQFMKSKSWTTERDDDQTNVRIYNGKLWIGYDDTLTVRIKSKFVLLRDLSGVGVWTIDEDVHARSGCGQHMGLTNAAKNTLATMETAAQKEIMESLEKDFESSTTNTDQELALRRDRRSSVFRVTQIIDRSGKILVITDQMQTTLRCTRQGYYRHPQDCGQFYRCVKFNQYREIFTIFEYDCPLGLVFDERWEVCSWPSVAPPCYGSNEIFAVPKDKFVCPGQGYYRDPENCRWFYKCTDFYGDGFYTTFEFRCPYDLVFDEENLMCTWRWLIPSCGGGLGQFSEGRHAYERIPSYDAAYAPTYLSNTSTIVRPSSHASPTGYQDPGTLATLSSGRSVGGQASQHTIPQYVADYNVRHDIGRIGYATSSHIGHISPTSGSRVDTVHAEKAAPAGPVVPPVRISTPQFIIPSHGTDVQHERPIVHTGSGLSVHHQESTDRQLEISGDITKFESQVTQMEIPRLSSKTETQQATEMPFVHKLKESAEQSDLGLEIHLGLPIRTESQTQTAYSAAASRERYDPNGSKIKTIEKTSESTKMTSDDKPFRYGVHDSSTTSTLQVPVHPGFVSTFQETPSRTSYDVNGSHAKDDAIDETTSRTQTATGVTAGRSESSRGYEPHHTSPSQDKTPSEKVPTQYGTYVGAVTAKRPLVRVTPQTHPVLGIQPSMGVSRDRLTHITKPDATSPGVTYVPDREKFETVSRVSPNQGHTASEKIPLNYEIDAVTTERPIGQSISEIHTTPGQYPGRPVISGLLGVSYDTDRRKIENIDHTRPLKDQNASEKLPTHYDLHGGTVDTERRIAQSTPETQTGSKPYSSTGLDVESSGHTIKADEKSPVRPGLLNVERYGTDASMVTKMPLSHAPPETHTDYGLYPSMAISTDRWEHETKVGTVKPHTPGLPGVTYGPGTKKIETVHQTKPSQEQIYSKKPPSQHDIDEGQTTFRPVTQPQLEIQPVPGVHPSIGFHIDRSQPVTKEESPSPVVSEFPRVTYDADRKKLETIDHTISPQQTASEKVTVAHRFSVDIGSGPTEKPIVQQIPITQSAPGLYSSTRLTIDESGHASGIPSAALPVTSRTPHVTDDHATRKIETSDHTKSLQEKTDSETLPLHYDINRGKATTKILISQQIPKTHTVQGLYPPRTISTGQSENDRNMAQGRPVIFGPPSQTFDPDHQILGTTNDTRPSEEQTYSEKFSSHPDIHSATLPTFRPTIQPMQPIPAVHLSTSLHTGSSQTETKKETPLQTPSRLPPATYDSDHRTFKITDHITKPQEKDTSEKIPIAQPIPISQTVPRLYVSTDFSTDKSAHTPAKPAPILPVISGSPHDRYSPVHRKNESTGHTKPLQEQTHTVQLPSTHAIDAGITITKRPEGQRIPGRQTVQERYPSGSIITDRLEYETTVETETTVTSTLPSVKYVPDQRKHETTQIGASQEQKDFEKVPSHYSSSVGTATTIRSIIPSVMEIHPISDTQPSGSFHPDRSRPATIKDTATHAPSGLPHDTYSAEHRPPHYTYSPEPRPSHGTYSPEQRPPKEHIDPEKVPSQYGVIAAIGTTKHPIAQPTLKTQTVPGLYPLTGVSIYKSAQTQPKTPYPIIPGSTHVTYDSDPELHYLMPETKTAPGPHYSIGVMIDSSGHVTQNESAPPVAPASKHVGFSPDQVKFKPTDHASPLQKVSFGIVTPAVTKSPTGQRIQGVQRQYPSPAISTDMPKYKVKVETSKSVISGPQGVTHDTYQRKSETIDQTSISQKQTDSEKTPSHFGSGIGTVTTIRPVIPSQLEIHPVSDIHPSISFHTDGSRTVAMKETATQAPSGLPHDTYSPDQRLHQEHIDSEKVPSQYEVIAGNTTTKHPIAHPISKTQPVPGLYPFKSAQTTQSKPPYPVIPGSTHATYDSGHDSHDPISETQTVLGSHPSIGVITDSSGHATKTESTPPAIPGTISLGFGSDDQQFETTDHASPLPKDFATTKVTQMHIIDASTVTKRPIGHIIQEAGQGLYPSSAISTDRSDYKAKAETAIPFTYTLASTTFEPDERKLEMHDHTTSTQKQIASETAPAGEPTQKTQTVVGLQPSIGVNADRSAHVTRTEATLPVRPSYGPPLITYDPDDKKIETKAETRLSQEQTDSEKTPTHYGLDAGTVTTKKPIDQSPPKIQTVPGPHLSTGFSTDRFAHASRADKILPVTSAPPHVAYDPALRKIQPIEDKEPSQGQVDSHTLPSNYGLYTLTRTTKIIAQPTPKTQTFPELHPETHIGIDKSLHDIQAETQSPGISGVPSSTFHPSDTKIKKIGDSGPSQEHTDSKNLASGYGIDGGTGTTNRPTEIPISQPIPQKPTGAGPYSIRGFGTDRSGHSPNPETKIVGSPAQQHGGADSLLTQQAYTLPSAVTERTFLITDTPTQETAPPAFKHEPILPYKPLTVIQGLYTRRSRIRPQEQTGRAIGRKIIATLSPEKTPCTTDLIGVTWKTSLDYDITTTDQHSTDRESSVTPSSHAIDEDWKLDRHGTEIRVETKPQESDETPFFITRGRHTSITGHKIDQTATDEQSKPSGIGMHISRGKVKFTDHSVSGKSTSPKDLTMLTDKPETAREITRKPLVQVGSLEPHGTFSEEPLQLDTRKLGGGGEKVTVAHKPSDINNHGQQYTEQGRPPVTHLSQPHSTIQNESPQQTHISTGRRAKMGDTVTDGIITPSTFESSENERTMRRGQAQTVTQIQSQQHEGTPSTIGGSIGFGEPGSDQNGGTILRPSYTPTDSATRPEEFDRKTEVNVPILEDISGTSRADTSSITLGGIGFRIKPTTAPKRNHSSHHSGVHRSRPQDQHDEKQFSIGRSHSTWSASGNVKPASTYGLKPFPPPPKGTYLAEKDVQVYVSKSETYAGPITCERPGLFRHPENCNQFYECYWDRWIQKFTIHFFDCPVKLVYDSDITACNWPAYGRSCINQLI